jgi:hypothetical protein
MEVTLSGKSMTIYLVLLFEGGKKEKLSDPSLSLSIPRPLSPVYVLNYLVLGLFSIMSGMGTPNPSIPNSITAGLLTEI